VEAGFTYAIDDACQYPLPVTFTNGSLNGTEFWWNFDKGGAGVPVLDGSPTISRTFTNPSADADQTYTVELHARTVHSATSGLTCESRQERTLTVLPEVVAVPGIAAGSGDQVCAPDDITFTNASTGGTLSFRWDFGDGLQQDIGSESNVTHRYENRTAAPVTRTVSLTATNRLGCSNLTAATLPVTIYPEVEAIQSFTVAQLCPPNQRTELTLANSSLNGTDFTWTFTPDNAGGTTQTVTPASAGYPVVVLTNTNDNASVTYAVGFDARTTWNAGLASEITCHDQANGSPVVVAPQLVPSFAVAAPQAVCSGGTITFEDANTRGGDMTLSWDFGDGASATSARGANVPHVYTNLTAADLTPTAVVTATQALTGCTSTWSQALRVHPKVEAGFTYAIDDACQYPLPVTFTNGSLNGTEFWWNFDKGGAGVPVLDGSPTISRTFTNPSADADQTYTVELHARTVHSATSGLTCESRQERTLTVLPEVVAVPGIAAGSGDQVCAPDDITFTNASTGGTLSFRWDFGDGLQQDIGSESNVTHRYENRTAAPVTRTVSLTATNRLGCSNLTAATLPVTIYPEVEAIQSFTVAQLCPPNQRTELTLANSSLNGTDFTWTFTPDNAGGTTQTVTPASAGYPVVVLTNTNDNASVTYAVGFDARTTWNAGLASEITCHDQANGSPVVVAPQLVPSFAVAAPQAVCSGGTITFEDANTRGGDMTLVWDFGDGQSFTSAKGSNVPHIYNNFTSADIVSTATVTATQAITGCVKTWSQPVRVHPYVKADFSFEIPDYCAYPLKVDFKNASTQGNTAAGVTTNYAWDYGYSWGSPLTPQMENRPNKTAHSYSFYNADPNTDAVYPIGLTLSQQYASTGLTCTDDTSRTITVKPELIAGIGIPPDAQYGCSDYTLTFTNTSTGGSMVSLWDFANGNSANTNTVAQTVTETFIYRGADPNVNDFYLTPSHYPVKLTITNTKGCVKEAIQDIYVYPKVEADFTFNYDSVCTPFDVVFTNNSLNGRNFHWDYGYSLGGVNQAYDSQRPELTHTYRFDNETNDDIKNYTITLNARTEYANHTCQDTKTRNITVHPRVITSMVPDVPVGCSDHRVVFDNQSRGGALNFSWVFGDGESATSANRDDVSHTFVNRNPVDAIHNVTITATNVNGCSHQQVVPITTHPKVEAGFTFTKQSLCTPFYLDLANSSLNGNKYYWDFGYNGLDSVTRNKNTFSYLFDNPTANDILTYNIRLVSQDSVTGCVDTLINPITVYPRVVSRFDVDRVAGCNPLPVTFTNRSTGLASYLWDFGDGTITADASPAKNYSHAEKTKYVDYTATLTSTNANGCKSIKDTVIRVYPLVKSMFQVDRIDGCTPLRVTLSNSSLSPLYSYSWKYGDGRTSTAEQPGVIEFVNSTQSPPVIQNPVIRLTTSYTGDGSCADSMKIPVQVFPHVYPDFDVDYEGCHPHAVAFTNQTVSFSNKTAFSWDLGNSVNSYLKDPALTYTNVSKTDDKQFSVRLRATSEHGCVDSVRKTITVHPRPAASMEILGQYIACPPFDVQVQNFSMGTNLTYTYTFGDGTDSTTTSKAIMRHTFTNPNSETQPYQINLRAVSQFGCDDNMSQTVYVYPQVRTNFSFNPGNEACNPFEVDLLNTTANAFFYRWTFDDGTTSSLFEPHHRFVNTSEQDRVFRVNLRGMSEFDCWDTITKPLTVWAKPVANFAIDPPLKVYPDATFKIHNLSNPAADTWRYRWSFGDNFTSTQKNPLEHTYLSWGPKERNFRYDVSLEIENDHCRDFTQNQLYLLPAQPIAFFTSDIDSSCSPLEVHFVNASNYGSRYLWDFGDGTTSTQEEPIHIYTKPGYYNAKLTVFGDGGETFYYRPYRVFQNPTAKFAVFPQRVMLPDAEVHVYNLSKFAERYNWTISFEGKTEFTSNQKDLTCNFSKIGEYGINLEVFSVEGCRHDTTVSPAIWVEGYGRIDFPNAFKPSKNGPSGGTYDDIDYKNEVFHPFHYGVVEYKLMIFTRWGEQIFTSRDVNIGWDGYVNGQLCDQGVYIWRCIGKFTNGKSFDKRGNVTLLK